jgi:hypothetical protein
MTFEVSSAVPKTDCWKDYFEKNLYIGMELELDRNGIGTGSEKNVFGVDHTEYHEYVDCDRCNISRTCRGNGGGSRGEERCHKYFRENLVIAIQSDGSLGARGSEFLLHTGNLSTEEFVKRMPIHELIQNGYRGFRHGSIHCHLLIPYFKKAVPYVIFSNMWNLFRYYYIGIAYLSGTNRNTCTRPTEYCRFDSYHYSFEDKVNRYNGRDMLWFPMIRTDSVRKVVTDFNAEIRMFDDSVNVKHMALCRMIGKLLMMRAAELSTFGTWIFKKNVTWIQRCEVIQMLNDHYAIHGDMSNRMKDCAKELYMEMEHLMTQKEKSIFMELLKSPLWKNGRREVEENVEETVFDSLECLLTVKGISASTRQEYYCEVAKIVNATPDTVREKLSRMGAKWNKKTGMYSIQK